MFMTITGQVADIEPSVLRDALNVANIPTLVPLCMREETFGPTLPIMKVADENEAIRLANDCSYGLSANCRCRSIESGRPTKTNRNHLTIETTGA
jgi:acyl-CoA reductase-like NAD-dependent aldehyde dehydrogenase